MNLVLKVTFDNYGEWRAEFDSHEARAEVCDESKTTVGKIDDKSCIVMLYDVDMEGIHLRFGPVSRGGLRWSNRPNDFRQEILGLVKTQQTKNVVIIPVGSKGGFVIKSAEKHFKPFSINAKAAYQKFILGLLDITDSMTHKNTISYPQNVIRYDDQDPYLVVAADKGTATFSDIANAISNKKSFG